MNLKQNTAYVLTAAATLAIELLAYGAYRYVILNTEAHTLQVRNKALEQNLLTVIHDLAKTKSDLSNTQNNNTDLTQALTAEERKNGDFASQIGELSGTVSTLTKLSETDKELLQKYSKVYFLSDNYVPSSLSAIDAKYLYDKTRTEQIHTGVRPFLTGMIEAANRDNVKLEIISAYRSFGEQTSLKFGYAITYGSGANKFSADQGYSEHQLGTAVDFTTVALGAAYSKFDGSDGLKWLAANAYKYGFALSYPKGNAYYIYEPWHWRFVGTALATKLHDTNQYFYNFAQRDIDQYLVSIFD